jgi:hypothetical protein
LRSCSSSFISTTSSIWSMGHQGRFGVFGLEPFHRFGLCPTDSSLGIVRFGGLPSCAALEALPHRNAQAGVALDLGRCCRTTRLPAGADRYQIWRLSVSPQFSIHLIEASIFRENHIGSTSCCTVQNDVNPPADNQLIP